MDRLDVVLSCVQGLAALAVLSGALVLVFTAVDRSTSPRVRYPLIGLVLWSIWSLWLAANGQPDSPPGIAMTGLVAWVVLRHGRQIRGVLDGEDWWPGRRARLLISEWRPGRPRKPVARKLNPVWALFGNDDDVRDPGVWMSVRSWIGSPAHNLAWYVVGVADRDRIVEGPCGARLFNPRGGLLWSLTHVRIAGADVVLPFASWSGRHVCLYLGWRPSGAFGGYISWVGNGRGYA